MTLRLHDWEYQGLGRSVCRNCATVFLGNTDARPFAPCRRRAKKMTPSAYQQLIAEDRAWLAAHAPDCLERRHIDLVLEHSFPQEYPLSHAEDRSDASRKVSLGGAVGECSIMLQPDERVHVYRQGIGDERAPFAITGVTVTSAKNAALPVVSGELVFEHGSGASLLRVAFEQLRQRRVWPGIVFNSASEICIHAVGLEASVRLRLLWEGT